MKAYTSDSPITSLAAMDAVIDDANLFAQNNYSSLKFADAWPGVEDGNGIVLVADTMVEIPYAGFYTFATLGNEGFRVTLDGTLIGDSETPNDLFSVLYFEEAGLYDLTVEYFDSTDGVNLELYSALGDFAEWDSAFALLGDGGLNVWGMALEPFGPSLGAASATPEPATWAMMILGGIGLAVLRKRRTVG